MHRKKECENLLKELKDWVIKRCNYLNSKKIILEKEVFDIMKLFYKSYFEIDNTLSFVDVIELVEKSKLPTEIKENIINFTKILTNNIYSGASFDQDELHSMVGNFSSIVEEMIEEKEKQNLINKGVKQVIKLPFIKRLFIRGKDIKEEKVKEIKVKPKKTYSSLREKYIDQIQKLSIQEETKIVEPQSPIKQSEKSNLTIPPIVNTKDSNVKMPQVDETEKKIDKPTEKLTNTKYREITNWTSDVNLDQIEISDRVKSEFLQDPKIFKNISFFIPQKKPTYNYSSPKVIGETQNIKQAQEKLEHQNNLNKKTTLNENVKTPNQEIKEKQINIKDKISEDKKISLEESKVKPNVKQEEAEFDFTSDPNLDSIKSKDNIGKPLVYEKKSVKETKTNDKNSFIEKQRIKEPIEEKLSLTENEQSFIKDKIDISPQQKENNLVKEQSLSIKKTEPPKEIASNEKIETKKDKKIEIFSTSYINNESNLHTLKKIKQELEKKEIKRFSPKIPISKIELVEKEAANLEEKMDKREKEIELQKQKEIEELKRKRDLELQRQKLEQEKKKKELETRKRLLDKRKTLLSEIRIIEDKISHLNKIMLETSLIKRKNMLHKFVRIELIEDKLNNFLDKKLRKKQITVNRSANHILNLSDKEIVFMIGDYIKRMSAKKAELNKKINSIKRKQKVKQIEEKKEEKVVQSKKLGVETVKLDDKELNHKDIISNVKNYLKQDEHKLKQENEIKENKLAFEYEENFETKKLDVNNLDLNYNQIISMTKQFLNKRKKSTPKKTRPIKSNLNKNRIEKSKYKKIKQKQNKKLINKKYKDKLSYIQDTINEIKSDDNKAILSNINPDELDYDKIMSEAKSYIASNSK